MARQRIELAPEEAEELNRRARATTVSVRDRRRAEIILLGAQGLTQQRIAEQLGISRLAVNRWVGRFSLHRLDGLSDRAGRGRKPWLPQTAVQQVVEQAVTPPPHLGRWSCRTMARAAGISPASVQRLWAASEIKPHLSRTFKLSNDKRFEEKFWDVIGLYLNPPDKALVLCCDEKSQCQALERTQPGLPLGIGHIRTKTHDYVRHGTVTLFAALNYLEGKLITRLAPRHRHQEWLAFLKTIDEETPPDLDIHIIADNYATHKHPAVTRWLERHARFHDVRLLAMALVNEGQPPSALRARPHGTCLRYKPAIESLGLARRGGATELCALLERAPDVLASATHAAALLHLAALGGRIAVVELLLRSGVDVNKPSPIAPTSAWPSPLIFVTPLCAARAKGRKEVETLLVRHGAKEDIFTHAFLGDLVGLQADLLREPSSAQTVDPAVDALEITPIHHAIAGARVDALRVLLLHTSRAQRTAPGRRASDPPCHGAGERRYGLDAA